MISKSLKDLNELMSHKKPFKIPEAGPHKAIITGAKEEDNSLGTGSILKLEMEIVDGEDKGTRIFDTVNIFNDDEYTQKKGRAWLHYLNLACGFEKGYYPAEAEEYVGKKLVIVLSDKQGEAFNVLRYEPLQAMEHEPKRTGVLSSLKGLLRKPKDSN